MGHNTFLEPILILIMRINVGQMIYFPRKLMWVIIVFCATFDAR